LSTISLQRSRKLLQEQGYDTWIVEKPYNPYTKRREDLYNFADLIGIRSNMLGVTAIQATGEDCQSHIRKILKGFTAPNGQVVPPNQHLRTWLQAGNRFFIWAWRLRGDRGKRKTWDLKEYEFLLKDGQIIVQETGAKP
jgi:hypothetical protein